MFPNLAHLKSATYMLSVGREGSIPTRASTKSSIKTIVALPLPTFCTEIVCAYREFELVRNFFASLVSGEPRRPVISSIFML